MVRRDWLSAVNEDLFGRKTEKTTELESKESVVSARSMDHDDSKSVISAKGAAPSASSAPPESSSAASAKTKLGGRPSMTWSSSGNLSLNKNKTTKNTHLADIAEGKDEASGTPSAGGNKSAKGKGFWAKVEQFKTKGL